MHIKLQMNCDIWWFNMTVVQYFLSVNSHLQYNTAINPLCNGNDKNINIMTRDQQTPCA